MTKTNPIIRLAEIENVLVEILKCDADKYNDPVNAVDAIYKLAWDNLPEEKRPKQASNIVVSQIGLGQALAAKELDRSPTSEHFAKTLESVQKLFNASNALYEVGLDTIAKTVSSNASEIQHQIAPLASERT